MEDANELEGKVTYPLGLVAYVWGVVTNLVSGLLEQLERPSERVDRLDLQNR